MGCATKTQIDNFGKARGIFLDVAGGVAGANQLDGRLETQAILTDCGVPVCVAGNDRGVRMQGHAGDAS